MATSTPRTAALILSAALAALCAPLLLALAATANDTAVDSSCGPAGTGTTIAGVALDAEQMGNARTISTVTASRHLPVQAAVIALTTSYTEARLRNQLAQTDHDSEGLFQQRISIYGKQVADDPVKATGAFLDHLTRIRDWATLPVGQAAQDVQRSAHPHRYQPNAALGQALAGQLWPAAAATADSTTPSGDSGSALGAPTICAGGRAGSLVGPAGSTVTGTTRVPAGLVIAGTAKGRQAATYALAQLGKPYQWAAAGPDAYDCSGLTMAAWASAGVALPHFTGSQVTQGKPEPLNLSQALAGDLVFIPGADGTPADPRHVGMVAGYVDKPDGRHLWLVHAPMSGLPVELTEASRWAGQIVAVRHIA